uniref:RING-type domain-containing protein n=1 Tax=viral metagenome TaxID=1070528 RepID=A0A6C0IV60_9ZZZZ
MDDTEYCIFCYQNINLIKNNLCECNYYYHNKCYEQWINSSQKYECCICNKKIQLKFLRKKNFITCCRFMLITIFIIILYIFIVILNIFEINI